jgi:TetR/AcrR family transcriptional repressor of nem operon
MRNSRDEKARNHDKIVEIAAARMREAGTGGPGVAEIMNAAGLTHGGFYKHFGSRDELVAEAVDRAFAESEQAISAVTAGADEPLAAFVDWYVSSEHCEDPGSGCGVVAFGADVTREDDRVRSAYTTQVERYIAHLQQLIGDGGEEARRQATVMLSTLVGSVLVARAVDDPALSQEILHDVRAALKSSRPAGGDCASRRRSS